MPTIKDVLRALETLLSMKQTKTDGINGINVDSFLDHAQYQKLLQRLRSEEDELRRDMMETLKTYDRFPERYQAPYAKLEEFYKAAPDKTVTGFEKSVFIMTKFPDPGDPRSDALQRVIDSVGKAIQGCGYCARIASETDHHEWLWGNVELYLLGCAYGVAIVEDKYRPELNPNVAMEWGWMRGMGRRVLFLREKEFKNDRADWSGLTGYEFEWDNPEPGVLEAVKKFLPTLPE